MSNKKHLPLENEVRREAYNEAQRKDVEKLCLEALRNNFIIPAQMEAQAKAQTR